MCNQRLKITISTPTFGYLITPLHIIITWPMHTCSNEELNPLGARVRVGEPLRKAMLVVLLLPVLHCDLQQRPRLTPRGGVRTDRSKHTS